MAYMYIVITSASLINNIFVLLYFTAILSLVYQSD